MAGDGREPDLVKQAYGHNDKIKLIGFRSDVDDLLELSDFTLLPTRFSGESMPLTLIQSILAHVPIISTDIGQIKSMLKSRAGSVGVVIEPTRDDEEFVAALLEAMRKAVKGKLSFSPAAFEALENRFSIEACVDKYEELYGIRESREASSDSENRREAS